MSDVERPSKSSKSKHRSSKHSKEDKEKQSESSSKKRSSRHRNDSDDEHHRKHKHRRKDEHKRSSKKSSKEKGVEIIDDDGDDQMWVEKDVGEDGEHPLATTIPTAESLNLTSNASDPTSATLPPSHTTETKMQREEWMMPPSAPVVPSETASSASRMLDSMEQSLTEDYGDTEAGKRNLGGGVDFFSSLGEERKKKPRQEKPDPSKLHISHLELNTQLKEGKSLEQYVAVAPPKPSTPGGPGSQWRMQKLKRTYEAAEEEGRSVEELAIERYGTLEAFEQAKEERRVLDDRAERRTTRGGGGGNRGGGGGGDDSRGRERPGGERFVFNDFGTDGSRASSRASSFRKPGTQDSTPSTPQPGGGMASPAATQQGPANKRLDALRGPNARGGSGSATPSKASTPIPSALTPSHIQGRARALSPSSLNKLQAKVLRAKLMGQGDAEELERQYDEELQRSQSGGADEDGVKVQMVPTIDGRGRMYDIGAGRSDGSPAAKALPGNRKPKETFETRDPKTGELLRYNADDDSTTLGDMLRQERFGAGMSDQKDMDMELASAILKDGKFQNDLEYMDDNAERLGRKKMRSDAIKRQFAINDYARTQKVMASCQFCYGEDDSPPKAGVIAMGTRAYLCCTTFEELVDGHCYIAPIQHHLSMLEADDDVWDEVKNFMKCLMQMFHDQDKGVVFYETVLNLKWQKHTVIECVPVPLDLFQDLPAYFKESILASEAEWSQHKKLIDFTKRPGGFRRAMVPNLPYFMVQWDYKGEKGYGHVIEGTGDSAQAGEDPGAAVDEGDKGGGDFPKYFAAEIIGNQLDLEPRKWRRPRKVDARTNKERVGTFKAKYAKYDWTHLISKG